MAVEFKYHRERSSTLPKPQLAGGLFSDLSRLAIAHSLWHCACYFVYLSDPIMVEYLSQVRHGCADFATCEVGDVIVIGPERVASRSKTFIRALNGFVNAGTVECVFSTMVSEHRYLRIFSVQHAPGPEYSFA
jgi:hypothetical protein